MIRKNLIAGPVLLLVFLMFSCTQPGPTSYLITGTIHDGNNGDLISGATFRFSNQSSTTGSDGAFSIDLGTTAGTFTGPLGISASGYSFMYIETIAVNTAENNQQLLIKMRPSSDATYTLKDLHCKVYDTDGITEITTATVTLGVSPRNGLLGAVGYSVAYGPGYYPFSTRRYSADCLVIAVVSFADPTQSFVVHKTGVDLSGGGPIDISFTKPSTGLSNVDLTVDSTDCMAQGNYVTPYGLVPIFAKYTSLGSAVLNNTIFFKDGTATESVSVYDPDAWQCFWSQNKQDTTYGGTGWKAFSSSSAIMALQSALTIPSLNTGLGPTADPNVTSWTYTGASGALYIEAVTGTQVYAYDVTDGASTTFGTIVALSNSVTLPAWLNSIISGQPSLKFSLRLMDSDLATYNLSFANLEGLPPAARFGMLQLNANDPYTKTFP